MYLFLCFDVHVLMFVCFLPSYTTPSELLVYTLILAYNIL